jgi:hypothetical protein
MEGFTKFGLCIAKVNYMNYQEIENKLVEFAHKKEGKDFPIHYVSIGTAVDFAIELVKNCSIPDVVGRSEQLVCDNHHADLEHFMNYSESICKTCKQKV